MQAFVNHGRWLVSCPCNSAAVVAYPLAGFLCIECGNQYADGKPLPIEWPPATTVAAIEALLAARPFPTNRNWTPGEAIGDLLAENIAHGIDA